MVMESRKKWSGCGTFRDTGLAEETIQAAYNQARETARMPEVDAEQQLIFPDDEERYSL